MVFYILGFTILLKMGKIKEQYNTFLRKNITTIMRCVHGQGTVFPVKLKYPMNLIEEKLPD